MRISRLSTVPLMLSLTSCVLIFNEASSTQSESDGGDLADGATGQTDATTNDASPSIDGSPADAMTPCLATQVDCGPGENPRCQAECITQFDETGPYTAEPGCNTLTIEAWGAGGGSGMSFLGGGFVLNKRAAAGGYAYTDYSLQGSPREFAVFVGTAGGDANNFGAGGMAGDFGAGAGGKANGINAGGGGGGGGFSGVFTRHLTKPTSVSDVVAIAGGGGGAGGNTVSPSSTRTSAGAGGGSTGQNGGCIVNPGSDCVPSLGGDVTGNTILRLTGADGADMLSFTGNGGGGGGGGYQGGQGGNSGEMFGIGGAGGSGFVSPDNTSNTTLRQGDDAALARPPDVGSAGQPGRVTLTCKP